jgi:hypothetical protein
VVDGVYERAVEVLWAFYDLQEVGTPQTVAMALGRDPDSPVFRADIDKLYEVGALEVVDMPAFGDRGSPEVYRVTLKGEHLLGERDYPIDRVR